MTPNLRSIYILLTLAGAAVSAWLIHLGTGENTDLFCQIFHTDCLAAVTSRFGKILGFSVASLGLGYFGALALLAGLARAWPGLKLVAALIQALGLLASLAFLYILQNVLASGCAWCYAIHGLNAAALVLLWFMLVKEAFFNALAGSPATHSEPDKEFAPGTAPAAALSIALFLILVLGSALIETRLSVS